MHLWNAPATDTEPCVEGPTWEKCANGNAQEN